MITIIAYVLAVIANLMGANSTERVVIIPPMPNYAPNPVTNGEIQWDTYMSGEVVNDVVAEYEDGCMCDDCYHAEVFGEALMEFNALFNSYEVKRARNGALMIRSGNSGSFKFAKKG